MSNSLQPHGLYNPPGSSLHGILQERILEWVAITSPRDLSAITSPRDLSGWGIEFGLQISHTAGWFFFFNHLSHQGNPISDEVKPNSYFFKLFYLTSSNKLDVLSTSFKNCLLDWNDHIHHLLWHSDPAAMVWMFVFTYPSPKFLCWNLNTQHDGIRRWGIWRWRG